MFPTERTLDGKAYSLLLGTLFNLLGGSELGIDLDKRDVEQEAPYQELLALGGDANKIPYLYVGGELIEGQEAVLSKLEAMK